MDISWGDRAMEVIYAISGKCSIRRSIKFEFRGGLKSNPRMGRSELDRKKKRRRPEISLKDKKK